MGQRSDYAYGTSDYLKADDLAGKSVRVKISDVEDIEFDKGVKPVLSFEGNNRKRLVVNMTNFDILCGIDSDSKNWPGHTIVLRGEKVPFKGKMVNSIRVVLPQPKPEAFDPEEPPFEEDDPR